MILGVIWFCLEVGPIIWGLIGLVGRFSWDVHWITCTERLEGLNACNPITELIIMIDCQEDQVEMVKQTLQGHFALGISFCHNIN